MILRLQDEDAVNESQGARLAGVSSTPHPSTEVLWIFTSHVIRFAIPRRRPLNSDVQSSTANMSNIVKYYFIAPTWHNHPTSGTLQLGNIITDLRTPEQPVHRGPPPPPPATLESPPDLGAGEQTASWQTNYEFSTDALKAGKLGLWAKFLSILGVGVNLGYEWDNRLVSLQPCRRASPINMPFMDAAPPRSTRSSAWRRESSSRATSTSRRVSRQSRSPGSSRGRSGPSTS